VHPSIRLRGYPCENTTGFPFPPIFEVNLRTVVRSADCAEFPTPIIQSTEKARLNSVVSEVPDNSDTPTFVVSKRVGLATLIDEAASHAH
jgi:hypothetical protein